MTERYMPGRFYEQALGILASEGVALPSTDADLPYANRPLVIIPSESLAEAEQLTISADHTNES